MAFPGWAGKGCLEGVGPPAGGPHGGPVGAAAGDVRRCPPPLPLGPRPPPAGSGTVPSCASDARAGRYPEQRHCESGQGQRSVGRPRLGSRSRMLGEDQDRLRDHTSQGKSQGPQQRARRRGGEGPEPRGSGDRQPWDQAPPVAPRQSKTPAQDTQGELPRASVPLTSGALAQKEASKQGQGFCQTWPALGDPSGRVLLGLALLEVPGRQGQERPGRVGL